MPTMMSSKSQHRPHYLLWSWCWRTRPRHHLILNLHQSQPWLRLLVLSNIGARRASSLSDSGFRPGRRQSSRRRAVDLTANRRLLGARVPVSVAVAFVLGEEALAPPHWAEQRVNIRFRFQAMVKAPLAAHLVEPTQKETKRKPSTHLMMPNTGSGICLRRR